MPAEIRSVKAAELVVLPHADPSLAHVQGVFALDHLAGQSLTAPGLAIFARGAMVVFCAFHR